MKTPSSLFDQRKHEEAQRLVPLQQLLIRLVIPFLRPSCTAIYVALQKDLYTDV